jgi:hypothetical protein
VPVAVKALALGLAQYAKSDGSGCRPGDRLLAEKLGVSLRTVKRWRAYLVAAGYLAQTSRGRSAGRGGGEGRAAVWQLTTPANEGPPVTREPGMRGQLRPNEGTASDRMRGQVGHPNSSGNSPRTPHQAAGPREKALTVIRATGADEEEAMQILEKINQPHVRQLDRYVAELASRGHLDRLLKEVRRPPSGPPSIRDQCTRCGLTGHDAKSCTA